MERQNDRDRLKKVFPQGDLFGIHPVHIDEVGIVGAHLVIEDQRLLLFAGRLVCDVDCTTMDRRMVALDISHIDILRNAGALNKDDADLSELRVLR